MKQESDHLLGIISIGFLDGDVKAGVTLGSRDGSVGAVIEKQLYHHRVTQGRRQKNRSVALDVILTECITNKEYQHGSAWTRP